MSDIRVEIGQYKSIDKGALKATFSLVIHPHGQKLLDCKYFNSGSSAWFSFPAKEIKKQDGSKSDFIPLVSYLDKDYLRDLQKAVLTELKKVNQPQPRESNGSSYSGEADTVQGQTSELPF